MYCSPINVSLMSSVICIHCIFFISITPPINGSLLSSVWSAWLWQDHDPLLSSQISAGHGGMQYVLISYHYS